MAIRFDDKFPEGFDLADPWPTREDWSVNGRYRGPSFEDCLTSATWATSTVQIREKKGPPVVFHS